MTAAGLPAPTRGLQRAMLTICAMTATIMQALDTTVANVALPYMQGSLSASLDQVNWILTSYIVASAILTAPVGWLAGRFGRKALFVVCTAGFTFASLLCGPAPSIEQVVMFRLLQGMFGAGLIPVSQAVMLDSYWLEERGQAMAIWGMGIMLGPIMGPTLGGWLTETYNWRWVFLINMPIGVVTVIGLLFFMDETEPRREMRFDWFGFVALAIGIGAMQLMVDRGQQLGWFDSTEIVIELVVAVLRSRAARSVRAVPRRQLRRRLPVHGHTGHDRVCHHDAVGPVPADCAWLSGDVGGADAGRARDRHHGRDAGGREAPQGHRGAHADLRRHDSHRPPP